MLVPMTPPPTITTRAWSGKGSRTRPDADSAAGSMASVTASASNRIDDARDRARRMLASRRRTAAAGCACRCATGILVA